MSSTHAELIEKSHALATLESQRGYLHFLDHVIVDAQPKKRPFREIAETWQWDRSVRCAGALDYLASVSHAYEGPRSFWNGYHKGSDKTHDNAREICWLLGWSKRRLNIIVCAGSEDQAALITTAMKGILADNRWIAERVQVTDLTAKGESGSELEILSMNAYTSQGAFPDYIIAEEITHWMYDEGRMFWESFILGTINKRPQCILKVSTNAGHIGSWQWEERNRTRVSKFWSFYEAPVGNPLPSWMNQEKIDDDSQGMDPGERDRLYKNRWIDPGEEYGYLTLEDCEKCIDPLLQERVKGERGIEYFATLDYGGVKDRAALSVMHVVPGTDTAIVDRLDCWQGTHDNRIEINYDPERPHVRSVQGWLEVVMRNFMIQVIVLDKFQLEGLAIYYEKRGRRVERFDYKAGKKNHLMAQLMKASIQNRKVTWSRDAGRLPKHMAIDGRVRVIEDDTFAKELAMLVVKPMIYGYRFDHESGRHDDRAVAVGMGLLHAFPMGPPTGDQGPIIVPDPRKMLPAGVIPSRINQPAEAFNPIEHYKIFGGGGNNGSAWERGDLGDRP